MSDTSRLKTCQMVCWGLAGLSGFIVLLASTRSMGLVLGVLSGVVVAVVLGIVFRSLVCNNYPHDERGIEAKDVVRALRNATGITGYKAPPDQAGVMEVALGSRPKPSNAAQATVPTPDAPAADKAAAAVKPGTVLGGEQELAERKGEWRYDATDAAKDDEAAAGVDAAIGVRPAGLSTPKDGQADDLKQIKGVGPKLEKLCHEFGFYHFEQIAAWGPDEVAWVDENLVGFKGRVSRDEWVEQAKSLTSGGKSDPVAKGDTH